MVQQQNQMVHQSILAIQEALQTLQVKATEPQLMFEAKAKLNHLMQQLKEEGKSAPPSELQAIQKTEQQMTVILNELNHQLHQQQRQLD